MPNDELKFTELNPPERSRKYIFPNREVKIFNVTAVCVRPSGTHRLNADGKLYIVNPGWIAVEIDADAWTF